MVGGESVFGSKTFVSSTAVGSVGGTRTVSIASPTHASRSDLVTAPAPVPAGPTTTSPFTETATTKVGTLATGSAKLKDTAATTTVSIGSCKKSTGTGTEKVKSYPKTLYSTPSTNKLTLHSSVGGNITVLSGSGANYGGLNVFFHT